MQKLALAALTVVLSNAALADAAGEQKVRDAIKSMVPTANIETIADSALPGFFEVVISGNVLYASADGKYLVQGRVYDVALKRDLTEGKEAGLRKGSVDKIGADKRIVFAARNPKHRITVFTDIDCGYCRKLHQEIAQYNDLGISVEYLFFPRAGLGSPSFDKAVTVWCSADRNQALTDAKAGVVIKPITCNNPVTETFMLGQRVGVTGTPSIVAADGTLIGGYMPPPTLLQRLEAIQSTAKAL
ncbi:MAG: disulfide bond formation protein DsbC [Lysobacterales bacterium CG02_land_8_20_14_3_00_62_12]|nr:MAG: disulfide bond formation protein DsbC [Xanthomonadales bacterium CG02_land_8_20_14_3_00_62_12]